MIETIERTKKKEFKMKEKALSILIFEKDFVIVQ